MVLRCSWSPVVFCSCCLVPFRGLSRGTIGAFGPWFRALRGTIPSPLPSQPISLHSYNFKSSSRFQGLWPTLITVVPASPRLFRFQKAGCGAWYPVAGPPHNSTSGARTFMPLLGGKTLYGFFCFLCACCWVAHFCRQTPPLSHHNQRPHSSPVVNHLWVKARCRPCS